MDFTFLYNPLKQNEINVVLGVMKNRNPTNLIVVR